MNDNQYLHNQLIKRGDMMGDGLHHEPDGKWIAKEYKKISMLLFPELKGIEKERRKRKSDAIDILMNRYLEEQKCNCGGSLKQVKSGTTVCQCTICELKYKVTFR